MKMTGGKRRNAKNQRGGAAAAAFGKGAEMSSFLGFASLCVASPKIPNYPLLFVNFLPQIAKIPPSPLQNQYSMVFIRKVLLGFQTSPSTFPFLFFSFFFINFDFSYFFCIFKNEQYQRQLNKENQ